jgi:fatty acid desaturase
MNMVPDASVFTQIDGNDKILTNGHPTSQWRTELRHIPNFRNAISVTSIYVQTFFIIWVALELHNPITYVIAFLLMGRAHAQLLALMHESVHRLLFRNRKLNDFAGRWLLGYMSFVNTDGYRYVHMAHHREEFGPNEPDIPLYANYPITRASFWRKMRRDGLGSTGFRMLRGQFMSIFKTDPQQLNTQRKIFSLHAVLLILSVIFVNPWVYVMLWLVPYITVWRVMNRLRSIAEHGGLRADDDRRVTTHSVKQHLFSSFYFVPFNLGWHIAHHTDSGIPFRSLPKYHRQLQASGFVTDAYQYSSYLAIWRALRSRPEALASAK